ncbi:MAG TPA: phosphatase PAP2 family protein [Jatrophihabitans sp.]
MLKWRRPLWWQELLLIAIGYAVYTETRNHLHGQEDVALDHGYDIQHWQDVLHLNFERSLNTFVARNEWLAQAMDYFYATMHFIVTIWVLVWLFRKRPHLYRGARTVLISTTLIGLAVFYLYPLAPPRLLPNSGYVDTLSLFHTWGSLADPKVAEHSNQFAAMPSLHTAWALWAALSVFFCARHLWIRLVALLHPVITVIVIMSTANHYIFDAVGGVGVLALGFAVQRLFSGHGAYAPPLGSPGLTAEGEALEAHVVV